MQVDSVILRKSPVILLTKMIAMTVLVYLFFGAYSVSLLNQQEGLPLQNILTGKGTSFIVSLSAEALIMIILFLKWNFMKYEILPGELITKSGILSRKQEIHSLKNMQTVYVSQGMIGTMFGFGTIKLHNPLSKEDVIMRNIPDPEKYSKVLKGVLDEMEGEKDVIVKR